MLEVSMGYYAHFRVAHGIAKNPDSRNQGQVIFHEMVNKKYQSIHFHEITESYILCIYSQKSNKII